MGPVQNNIITDPRTPLGESDYKNGVSENAFFLSAQCTFVDRALYTSGEHVFAIRSPSDKFSNIVFDDFSSDLSKTTHFVS